LLNFEKPPIDILEDEEKYIIVLDLPGCKREDIEITADENSLKIRAIKNLNFTGKYILMERFTGVVRRNIKFPEYIDISKSRAFYENGCLVIYVPKAKNKFIIDTICKISIF